MSGAKNKSSVSGMRSIDTKNGNGGDRVCLITFSCMHPPSSSFPILTTYRLAKDRVVFPLTEKGTNDGQIQTYFNSLAPPEGGTAFFDALGSAFYIAAANPSKNEQWLIALTDGDDNQR